MVVRGSFLIMRKYKEKKVNTLKPSVDLQQELGDELYAALTHPDNTGAVRELAEKLVGILPTAMTIGKRCVDILSFFKGKETSVPGQTMVDRATEMSAHNGKEEYDYLLERQDEIPAALRGKVVFVFTDYRHPDDPERVAYVFWSGDRWVRGWGWFGRGFNGRYRVLRSKSA